MPEGSQTPDARSYGLFYSSKTREREVDNMANIGLKSGTGVVFYQGKDVLLQKRTRDAPVFQSCWATFGGQSEGGKTPHECAIREIEEELGIHLDPADLEILDTIRVQRSDSVAEIHFFAARFRPPLSAISLGEGIGFALFNEEECRGLTIIPEVERALRLHFDRRRGTEDNAVSH